MQGVTHANADNLFIERRPTSVVEVLIVFMIHSKVNAILKKEKEKASSTFLNLRPSYLDEVATKP